MRRRFERVVTVHARRETPRASIDPTLNHSTLALLTLTFSGALGIAQAQDQPAVNSPLIVKTIVAHISSIVPSPSLDEPRSLRCRAQEVLPPAFTQPPYIVGPVVVPTTTAPQAEEHITSDPNNFLNLLAMISDFSFGVSTPASGRFRTTAVQLGDKASYHGRVDFR
jgi:hypothetical protein